MKLPENSTLLIVDDNPTNIKLLYDLLKEHGFRILVAKDGQSAIEKLEVANPDLVLLDVMMPGIDGFTTCQIVKSNPKYQDLPIIFMTALSENENKVKGLSLGAVDYVTKPFQPDELLARVNLHLKLYHLTKELAEKNAHLHEMNELLEQKVEERTSALQKAQTQLIFNEKMSFLGQLMAGITHEINNPISFIDGNIKYAHDYVIELINLINLYQKNYPNPVPEITEKIAEVELDYLMEDLLNLIVSMKEGTKRIAEINQSMRAFSRSDTQNKFLFNPHEGLESTLLLFKHRLKANEIRPAIEVIKKYDILPEINCYPGSLNQVFMNLLANAIDAVEESNTGRSFAEIKANPNQITICTKFDRENERVIISIKDNGIGIKQENKLRIFEQFFTTKIITKGTGLGMTISRHIVEEKHGGTIDFISTPSQGTEFTVKLPIK
ncbi:hybrid sensor histidine kinase/response regulator [Phormidium sp. LEGE 05292]|uniref:hybrid sensor histidine kinase/response regulator n=1 Tax=[Phormidium] sp. LEGE 05292 TaxID=767427 RepID=UPI001880060A|nr:response regulator [Phormidium sp. LEGE 05292]MBE9229027.1 hybrid sensor histidine kinase/response regulator [Phormidium sp. LEGE 05292]